ncbi:MAG: alpha/beta hydrolase [Sphaerochaetaceae bacterium]|nr:alpha/beta hydrolase [Sphaerochaetaceae bacterium]
MNTVGIVVSVIFIIALILYFIYFRVFGTRGHQESKYLYTTFTHDYTDEEKKTVKQTIAKGVEIPYETIEVLSNDNLVLRARYYHVSTEAPTDIFVSGYNGLCRRDFAVLFQHSLNTLHHNVLLTSNRAHDESTGHFCTFGKSESEDIIVWIGKIVEMMPQSPINVIGFSLGASACILASPYMDSHVKKLVADAPFSNGKDEMRYMLKKLFPKGAKILFPLVRFGTYVYGGFRLSKIDVVKAAQKCLVPVLLIHSKGDKMVPFEMGNEVYQALGENKQFLVLSENTGHGEGGIKEKDKYLSAITNFLEE